MTLQQDELQAGCRIWEEAEGEKRRQWQVAENEGRRQAMPLGESVAGLLMQQWMQQRWKG